MTTSNVFKSDLYGLYSIVQSSALLYPKELTIYTLRNFFSKDSFYAYRQDHWGFPQTPDHTDLPLSAGFNDSITTRLFIGENNRSNLIYYPSVIVRSGGSSSVPISINREVSNIQWSDLIFEDGYGNIKTFKTPKSYIFAGAWEGSVMIEVFARDFRTRDDLVDLISMLFVDIAFEDMKKAGIIVKSVSSGSPAIQTDRNDPLFNQTVTLQIRNEWRREVPVNNIIEIVNSSLEFGNTTTSVVAPNLTINNISTLTDILNNL